MRELPLERFDQNNHTRMERRESGESGERRERFKMRDAKQWRIVVAEADDYATHATRKLSRYSARVRGCDDSTAPAHRSAPARDVRRVDPA